MPIFVPRSHYDPNQPRVPSGEPGAGQWTDAGGSGSEDVQAGGNGSEDIQKANAAVGMLIKLFRGLSGIRPSVPTVPRLLPPMRPGIPGVPPKLPDMPPRGLGIPPVVPGVPLLAPKSFEADTESAGPTNQEVLSTAFRALAVLSERYNSPDRQAFVGIRVPRPVDEENPGDADGRNLDLDGYGISSPAKVNEFCKNGLSAVQQMVNEAVRKVNDNGGKRLSAQAYGIAVHSALENMIKNPKDAASNVDTSKFRAEISYGKDESSEHPEDDVPRGQKGSIRIDVVQVLGNGTVCMYDLKTGLRPLSVPRMRDFAERVLRARNQSEKLEDRVKRVFVTQVRPEI